MRDRGLVHTAAAVVVMPSAPHSHIRLTYFYVACTRLGWNYFISFAFCVRDKGLVHAPAGVRVPRALHSPTRLTIFLCCMHASGLELFYLVRVLCAGQGPGARTGWCACALSTSLPHPLDYFFYVACMRLGWNYFISFAFCLRDKGLVHEPAGVRVP